MRRAYAAAALVAFVAALSTPARAICGRGPAVVALPTTVTRGPRNAEVRVTLPSGWEKNGLCAREELGKCQGGALYLALRRAPEAGRAPRAVEARSAHSESGAVATEVLRPLAPLEPGDYEVWALDRNLKVTPRIVAIFGVTGAFDHTAPKWGGIKSAQYYRRVGPHGNVITTEGECGDDIARASIFAATDDETPPGALQYAVWTAPSDRHIDYDAPPALYTSAEPDGALAQIILGNSYEETSNFSTGATKANPYPPLRLGVRAVDLAGNMSLPSEIVLR